MTVCAVFGCKNRMHKGCGKHFFRFPMKDPERLIKWIEAVQRDDWKPSVHSKICSDHFTEKDYMIRPGAACPYLRMDAVPTPLYPTQRKKKTKKRKYTKKTAGETAEAMEIKTEDAAQENSSENGGSYGKDMERQNAAQVEETEMVEASEDQVVLTWVVKSEDESQDEELGAAEAQGKKHRAAEAQGEKHGAAEAQGEKHGAAEAQGEEHRAVEGQGGEHGAVEMQDEERTAEAHDEERAAEAHDEEHWVEVQGKEHRAEKQDEEQAAEVQQEEVQDDEQVVDSQGGKQAVESQEVEVETEGDMHVRKAQGKKNTDTHTQGEKKVTEEQEGKRAGETQDKRHKEEMQDKEPALVSLGSGSAEDADCEMLDVEDQGEKMDVGGQGEGLAVGGQGEGSGVETQDTNMESSTLSDQPKVAERPMVCMQVITKQPADKQAVNAEAGTGGHLPDLTIVVNQTVQNFPSRPPCENVVDYIPVDHAYHTAIGDKENEVPVPVTDPNVVKLRRKIKTLQKQVLRQGVKIKNLKKTLVDLQKNNMMERDPEQVVAEHCSGLTQVLFTQQLKNGCRRHSVTQYCSLMKEFALNLYCASPKSYKFCRLFLCLPHPVSLRNWKAAIEGSVEPADEGAAPDNHVSGGVSVGGEHLLDSPIQEVAVQGPSIEEGHSPETPMEMAHLSVIPVQEGHLSVVPVPEGHLSVVPVPQGHVSVVPVPEGHLSVVPVPEGHLSVVPVPEGHLSVVPVPEGHLSVVPVPEGHLSVVPVPEGHLSVVPVPEGHLSVVPVPEGHVSVVPVPEGHLSVVPVPEGHLSVVPVPEGHVSVVPVPEGHLSMVPIPEGHFSVIRVQNGHFSVIPVHKGHFQQSSVLEGLQ
ncbi:uncharacterized protein [Phyllobates terribilis]|uniref:uncharacterized protein n=1 Tax=Phyllobates terribilis TaxID=111132 RepID=UPI003CCAA5E3